MKIILATKNQGKLKEFQQLSKGMGFEFIAIPEELQEMPEETGKTFKENALIKASYVSEYFQMPALADDSGLEVDALNGDPGVYSARYSSSGSDLDNCKKLLMDRTKNPNATVDERVERTRKIFKEIGYQGIDLNTEKFYKDVSISIKRGGEDDTGFGRQLSAILGSNNRINKVKSISAPTLIIL